MAHLPPKKILSPNPFSQRKTLFTAMPGQTAVLVELRSGRRTRRTLKFANSHVALDWAISNNAAFVHFPCSDPASN
jgi:hypothetical protein